MRKFLIAASMLGLLASPAVAQDWSKEERTAGIQKYEWTRYVPSGVERQFEFLYAVKLADCSSLGAIVIRKLREPEHGVIEIDQGEANPTFTADSKYFKCNDQKVPGTLLKYKSTDEYVGADSFKVLVMYPTGFAREATFKIVVR